MSQKSFQRQRWFVMAPAGTAPARTNVREFPRERSGDAELVAAVARGDRSALAAVWRRHAPAVRATLCACLGPDHAVEDLLQNVFISLLRTAGNVQNPEGLRSYLLGAAIRAARAERRARGRRKLRLADLARDMADARQQPPVEARDAVRALDRLLAGLADRTREVFVLRYVQGLPTGDIAPVLGVSEATVKREVTRGRDRVVLLAAKEPALAQYLSQAMGAEP